MLTVCSACGSPYEKDERGSCPTCRPPKRDAPGRGTRRERGYDEAWIRLSRRARRLQPFCLDCGTPDDLTADHSPEAWERRDAGKAIRLEDIAVVCRACNAERGAARGEIVSWHGGQGMPEPADESPAPLEIEGCDGLCEGHCPEHRDPGA